MILWKHRKMLMASLHLSLQRKRKLQVILSFYNRKNLHIKYRDGRPQLLPYLSGVAGGAGDEVMTGRRDDGDILHPLPAGTTGHWVGARDHWPLSRSTWLQTTHGAVPVIYCTLLCAIIVSALSTTASESCPSLINIVDKRPCFRWTIRF